MTSTITKSFYFLFLFIFTASTNLLANTSDVVQELKDGNVRYANGALSHPHQDKKRRTEIAPLQTPKAIILSCSDSRVPPEIIFDQGLGDLFVIRVAGNVLNDINLGSIEYALEHLKIKDIIVLGHKRCGAITAAVDSKKYPGHIKDIVEKLKPAVKKAKQTCNNCDLIETAGHINVQDTVKQLQTTYPAKVTGAYYDLDSGKVEFIE